MNVPESVKLLMRRIEDEVVHRRAQMTAPKSIITSRVVDSTVDGGAAALPGAEFAIIRPDPVNLNLPMCDRSSAKAPFRLKTDASYHLNDFLPYDDVEFLNAAYQAILKREVDEDGMQTYLGMLRDGALKAEILGRLRDSPEGRQGRARVDGLSLSFVLDTISRWPIIGKFVGIVNAVRNLPNAQRDQRRISNHFAFRLTQTDQRIAEVTRTVYEALKTLEQSQNRLSELTQSFAVRSRLEAVQYSITRTTAALESKSDRGDLEKLALEFRAAVSAMEQVKANSDDTAALRLKIEGLAESISAIEIAKANSEELQSVRMESKANLKAGMDRAMELVNGIAQAKADQGSVDVLKRELIGAIEQVRIQMLQTLESKAERQETTALSNNLTGLLQQQPTKEEFERITAALAKTDDAIASVRQTKADNDDFALLRSAIEKETRDAVDGIHAFMNSKADQSSISGLHKKRNAALGELTHNAEAVVREFFDEPKEPLELLKREKSDQTTTDAMRVETKAALELVSRRVEDTLAPVISRTPDLKLNVLDQERRLGLLLEEARRRFPDPISPAQIGAMLAEEGHLLDAMYASFEDTFRRTRSDIRQRLAIYLPYIRDAKAGTGDAPVVDLGCGLGEWLEPLYSEGLSAPGVDLKRIFLAGCRELALDVTEQDALSFLQQRNPNSIGVVTSFHLIEHLPHKKLISLIDETLRVLRPGGMVIFEIPNPKNLIVSGCNFYLDPTHRHPLPPDLSRYLLDARGFCNVDILAIHPFGSEFQITEGATDVKHALNRYLFSAQDSP
jgi:SAM-dependent methyltransferase